MTYRTYHNFVECIFLSVYHSIFSLFFVFFKVVFLKLFFAFGTLFGVIMILSSPLFPAYIKSFKNLLQNCQS